MKAVGIKIWDERKERYLRERYATDKNADIAQALGVTKREVDKKASSMGLRKPAGFFAIVSSDPKVSAHQFKKGHRPKNKGVKGCQTKDAKKIANMQATQFKKGHRPKNTMPVGTEVRDTYGYWKVKTAEPSVWEFKHRVVWKEHHGEIPRGTNIQFRDGNRDNCDICNLYAITRREQCATENGIHRYPKEMVDVFMLKGALTRKIKELSEKQQTN